jgi:hypothetical protein
MCALSVRYLRFTAAPPSTHIHLPYSHTHTRTPCFLPRSSLFIYSSSSLHFFSHFPSNYYFYYFREQRWIPHVKLVFFVSVKCSVCVSVSVSVSMSVSVCVCVCVCVCRVCVSVCSLLSPAYSITLVFFSGASLKLAQRNPGHGAPRCALYSMLFHFTLF